jgi:LacI family transcriptional regulator
MRSIDTPLDAWRDATAVAREIAADPPEAVLCYDDKLALALMDALRSTRIEVPDDLALAGFDGIPAARQSNPRLTTVDVPSVEVGRRAAEMLMAAARGTMPASEIVPVSFVVGDSTPPRDARMLRERSAEMVAS